MAERWVTVSEAARLEGEAGRPVNKSSISRFLGHNGDVPVQRDSAGRVHLVDYDQLVAARSGSLAVQDKRAPLASDAPAARQPAAPTSTNRKRDIDAIMAEMDLAERRKAVVDRRAVTLAIENAGVLFVQGLERRRRVLATALSGMTDIRAIEAALKTADQALLTALADDLARAQPEIEDEDASPEPIPA